MDQSYKETESHRSLEEGGREGNRILPGDIMKCFENKWGIYSGP